MAPGLHGTKTSHETRVFLSWGGSEALRIGEWLKKLFDTLPEFCAFISSENISGGENFADTIHKELRVADEAIGIMTDVAVDRPWFLYEIAYLKSRMNVPLLRFGTKLPEGHPLYPVQQVEGTEFSGLVRLVGEFTSRNSRMPQKTRDLCMKMVQDRRAEWDELTRPILERNARTLQLRIASNRAIQAISRYKNSESVVSHSCMQALACKTLNDLATSFEGLQNKNSTSYTVDYRRYPDYLIDLQQSLGATTQAIAIIDDVEEFWAQRTGNAILETTTKVSQRVFVFRNEEQLARYFRQVLRHAEKYTVFVMSSRQFGRMRDRISRDFSLICDPATGHCLAALYDGTASIMQFTIDEETVRQKSAIFKEVVHWAKRIVATPEEEWDRYGTEIKQLLFTEVEEILGQHSSVIPIEYYDAFEEDHPFYREMHDRMLAEFRQRVKRPDDTFKILEIGAGTGLFTKKLIQQPFREMTVTAMEPDGNAHPLLMRKLQSKGNKVQILNTSVLTYDPQREFTFVFSSFSEHHIRPEDKARYFATLADTFQSEGYLIVGDEFLALDASEEQDPVAYEEALTRYHTYIIRSAKEVHQTEVADLERMALESGRPGAVCRIDYKVGLAWYKQTAAKQGFLLEAEYCISPPELAKELGGVYVLIFRSPARS